MSNKNIGCSYLHVSHWPFVLRTTCLPVAVTSDHIGYLLAIQSLQAGQSLQMSEPVLFYGIMFSQCEPAILFIITWESLHECLQIRWEWWRSVALAMFCFLLPTVDVHEVAQVISSTTLIRKRSRGVTADTESSMVGEIEYPCWHYDALYEGENLREVILARVVRTRKMDRRCTKRKTLSSPGGFSRFSKAIGFLSSDVTRECDRRSVVPRHTTTSSSWKQTTRGFKMSPWWSEHGILYNYDLIFWVNVWHSVFFEYVSFVCVEWVNFLCVTSF